MGKSKGPEFVQFFGSVLDALRKLGGSGRPQEVADQIALDLQISQEQQDQQLKSGESRFKNQVQWARFYLVRGGFIDSSKRGVWALTEKGRAARLDHNDALAVFQDVQRRFRSSPDATIETGGSNVDSDDTDSDVDAPSEIAAHHVQLLEILRNLPPYGFERLCMRLLREAGFEQVTVTQQSGDGGIDGYGVLKVNEFVGVQVFFQCKRYSGVVGAGAVRDFRGAMMGRAEKGIIITTGTFSRQSRHEASRDGATQIELVDCDALIDLFEKYEFGLTPVTAYQVDESFFDEYCDET